MTTTNILNSLSHSLMSNTITIEGLQEPMVLRYFETMNAEDYEATAALFADSGELHPPFEEPIKGPLAIATYLETEATGMQLLPREGIASTLEDGQTQVQVAGKVQTPVFAVNVSWIFILNPSQEIVYTRVKLLASPQELLSLRDRHSPTQGV